jgi:hypothetical protein
MPLTNEAIQDIKNQIEEDIANKTKWEILDIINNKMVSNPQPQEDILIEIESDDIFNLLSDESISNIIANDQMSTFLSALSDREQLVDFLTLLQGQEIIAQEELNNVKDYVNQTIPDPNYETTIPWTIIRFNRKITAEEAERVKNI